MQRIRRVMGWAGGALVAFLPAAALPVEGTYEPLEKVSASDGSPGDEFGAAVDLSGALAVVGAPGRGGAEGAICGAYVFEQVAGVWSEQQRIVASGARCGDALGRSVATDGNTIALGAPEHDGAAANAGAAWVFTRTAGTWTEDRRIVALDARAGDRFGSAVAVDGDTVVVGAPGVNHAAGTDAGAAYVYARREGVWTPQQRLTARDASAFDRFGSAVAISGDTVVVGVPRDDDAGAASGAAYVFVRTGEVWREVQKLKASPAAGGDEFGTSVAVDADRIVVGAPFHDPTSTNAGSVFVYERSAGAWRQTAELATSDGALGDHLGAAVAVSGDVVIAGAPDDNHARGIDAGTVYVFVRSGAAWREHQRLTASDGAAGDLFGGSVALDGPRAAVGAPSHDDGGSAAGSVYLLGTAPSLVCPPTVPPRECNVPGGGWRGVLAGFTVSDAGGLHPVTIEASVADGPLRRVGEVLANGPFELEFGAVLPPLPRGTTSLTVRATNVAGLESTCALEVDVRDTTPPEVTCRVARRLLWPARGALLRVGLEWVARDACDAEAGLRTEIRVSSDEPDRGPPYGPDAALEAGTLLLRSERDVRRDGRVYLIVVETLDGTGLRSADCCAVGVPRTPTMGAVLSLLAQMAAAEASYPPWPPPGQTQILP